MKHNAECRAESFLISRCVHGEHVAWEELFERYDSTLVRAILRNLGARADDLELVDDLIQDVHVRLLVNEEILTRFDPARGTLQAYLAGVAGRTTKRHLQSDRRSSRAKVRLTYDIPDRSAPAGDDLLRIDELLARLPPQPRRYLQAIVFGTEKPSAAKKPVTIQERQWIFLIRRTWNELEQAESRREKHDEKNLPSTITN